MFKTVSLYYFFILIILKIFLFLTLIWSASIHKQTGPIHGDLFQELIRRYICFLQNPIVRTGEKLYNNQFASFLIQWFYIEPKCSLNKNICFCFYINLETSFYSLYYRYSDFCSTMGLYRNYSFETEMIKVLTNKLVYGNAGIIPTQFARIAAFIIAFDQTKKKYYNSMPKHIVSKLMENMQMFTPFDCLKISKGLQLVMDFQRRINLSHTFLQQFVSFDIFISYFNFYNKYNSFTILFIYCKHKC